MPETGTYSLSGGRRLAQQRASSDPTGTEANGWLAQLRNEGCRDRCMKPLKGNQQLLSVSRSYSVALQALKPKSSPRTRRGLDASTDRGLTERVEKCFCLTSSLTARHSRNQTLS